MNIKLRLLSKWTPKFILKRELDRTSQLTNEYLDLLLEQHNILLPPEKKFKGNLEESRTKMAAAHNKRIESLIKAIGKPKAIEVGKAQMFTAGFKLGVEARKQLKVETIDDTFAAAKILYNVLGIEFNRGNEAENMTLWIKSCALAEHYNPDTCVIMSSADRGVLKGLNPNMDMEFVERITTGAKNCKACIKYSGQKE